MVILFKMVKRRYISLLCCPKCHGTLSLSVAKEIEDDVIEGVLTCRSCTRDYPIRNGIPDMLVDGA
jgi:uncharacterized protein YbaR (Trm112 family)